MMTSSQNTEPGPGDSGEGADEPAPPAPRPNTALTRVEPTAVDIQVADLQSALEREREGRVEERWMWLAASGLLFVMLCYSAIGATAGSVCVVIYLTVIAVMGKRWGIEGILETLAFVYKMFGGSKGSDNEGAS
jgi:hypothetical protein